MDCVKLKLMNNQKAKRVTLIFGYKMGKFTIG